MKFVFEARASDYDLAAEQEILLRHVSNRRRNWMIAVGLCLATAVLAVVLVATGYGDMQKMLQVTGAVVGLVLIEQLYLDRSGGNIQGYLKMLYRGRTNQTEDDLNAILRLEVSEGDPLIHIYNKDGEAGSWDFRGLCRVTENEEIFDLCRKGMPKQYLALPKNALVEGTEADFRALLNDWLGEKKSVETFTIPAKMQKQLMQAKYKLFKH